MSDYFRQNATVCRFSNSESWVILSEIEQRIKAKIEAVGTPLKDWDIQINYGIKTGFNEAFIIDDKKRQELIEQDPKSDEIIRPILRGRDIKRYGYENSKLYLINTHNGIKEKGVKPIDINDYPAVKQHLDNYYPQLEKRQDKGDTPYNLRNCAYIDLFFRQKICWKAVGRNLTFSLVEEGVFLTAPASFISSDFNPYILAFLCSNVGKYFIYQNSDTTGAGDIMLNIQSLVKFSIPKLEVEQQEKIKNLVLLLIENQQKGNEINKIQEQIDFEIYQLYGFSEEEIAFIESK